MRKLDKLTAQVRYMGQYGIETPDDLYADRAKLEREMASMTEYCSGELSQEIQIGMGINKGDIRKRRAIINIFVRSVYLYDDHFTLIINASRHPLDEKDVTLDDIESEFEGDPKGGVHP